jgi:lysylphosphatidylglycerol synthetase-like protein (DUF2156 family)
MTMIRDFLKPTRTMLNDSKGTHVFYTLLAVLLAVAMFMCASGSGNPSTAQPLPDVINTASNVLCVLIGILVLVPKTRALASVAAGLNMLASMVTNYLVDGYDYFLQVLTFDLAALGLSLLVLWHYRKDLKAGFS